MRNPRFPTVVIGTSFDDASVVALARARAIAEMMGARLVIVHVLPPRTNRLEKGAEASPARGDNLVMKTAQKALAWCSRLLDGSGVRSAIIIKRGSVAAGVLGVARELDSELIVIGDPREPRIMRFVDASNAAQIMEQALRPVLLARTPRKTRAIVATTNFIDDSFPALSRAAWLGAQTSAPVTFLHNVDAQDTTDAAVFFAAPFPVPETAVAPDVEDRRTRLEVLARAMGSNISSTVSERAQATDAILDLARDRDADIIVVGTKTVRRSPERECPRTAIAVACGASASVLTVPMVERRAANWS